MSNLPQINGRQAIAAFGRDGFVVYRISGSHHILKKPGHAFLLTVPVHGNKPLRLGLLKALIRGSGLTVEKFRNLL